MTKSDIDELKSLINAELREKMQRYIGEPLDKQALCHVEMTVRATLDDLLRKTGWSVLAELEPDIRAEKINGLTILFDAKSDAAVKFLKGEE